MAEKQKSIPPDIAVIQAFGGHGDPLHLAGGEGQSYQVGDLVLKPALEIPQTTWIAQTLNGLKEDGFRINRPIQARNGQWVYEGWQAFAFIPGRHEKGRWKEKIELSRLFHTALRGIEKPDFIGKRNNPWERADLAIWGDKIEAFDVRIQPVTDRLQALMRPIDMPEQLIHGDMTGNILFHESLSPAVIDFSPYWRPAEYATAIIIVDALVWEHADDSILHELENKVDYNQLLVRAALWRIKTTEEFSKLNQSDPTKEIESYRHLIDLLTKRINSAKGI